VRRVMRGEVLKRLHTYEWGREVIPGVIIQFFPGIHDALPGPFATTMLADMGAEALRIVSGSRPDPASFVPPASPCYASFPERYKPIPFFIP
jgi:hypothetical protein